MLAPFPWFGGKSMVAGLVWSRLGDAPNYVEPFAGSLAVLLARPDNHRWWDHTETVNDADGLLCNFWRAVSLAPNEVAAAADWPVSECDLHARHLWLVGEKPRIVEQLCGDPGFFDAKAAGWWVWGLCSWIGGGWCSGKGPWVARDGMLTHEPGTGRGVKRKRPHLGDAGKGINRKLQHLRDAGQGHAERWSEHIRDTMRTLGDRMRRVRVCCGDWERVLGPSPTVILGTTAVFLDPPYGVADRDQAVYSHDSIEVSHAVRRWALEHGDDPAYRICLAGYEGEHEMPPDWECVAWKAHGGYAGQGDRGGENARRERLWFSPGCRRPEAERQLDFWTDPLDFAAPDG